MKKALVLLLLFCALSAFSQPQRDSLRLSLDFPLLDFPYQSLASQTSGNFFAAYSNPSMKQSLEATTSFYSAAHFGVKAVFRKVEGEFLRELLTQVGVSLFDLFTISAPLGDGWLHEEYHRAVLTRRNVSSANEMNRFPMGTEAVKVYKIRDQDLERMHDQNSKDFLRLQVAGKEGELHLMRNLQRNNFFYYDGNALPNIPLYWIATLSSGSYLRACARGDLDELVDEMNQADGANILNRDFTGPDYTAWAKALFRPNQRYREARGVHPSGVGIDRYLKTADLTQEEVDYLRKQGALQWLNVLNPALFGFPKFRLKSSPEGDTHGSFAVRNILNPFGSDISLDLFYLSPRIGLTVTVHNYFNQERYFPGLELALIEHPAAKGKLFFSPRLQIWNQPEDLSFTAQKGELGGLAGLKVQARTKAIQPYVEVLVKTPGWVMGEVFLESNLSLNAGLNWRIR